MAVIRGLAAALALALLGACAAEEVGAPPGEIARAAHPGDAASSLTLVTVINERTGNGAHTALVVDGSQRVVFDPAGTFNEPVNNPRFDEGDRSRAVVERGDVLYGMTDRILAAYVDYHTRTGFRTVEQTVRVPAGAAERALALVQSHGPASKATCARSTSRLLGGVPGFGGFPVSWYPLDAMEAFGAYPGVETVVHRDGDPADNGAKRAAALPGL